MERRGKKRINEAQYERIEIGKGVVALNKRYK
jgi:hypothetical protein